MYSSQKPPSLHYIDIRITTENCIVLTNCKKFPCFLCLARSSIVTVSCLWLEMFLPKKLRFLSNSEQTLSKEWDRGKKTDHFIDVANLCSFLEPTRIKKISFLVWVGHLGPVSQSARQLSGPLSCYVLHSRWKFQKFWKLYRKVVS